MASFLGQKESRSKALRTDEVLKYMARLWQFDMLLESVDENRLDVDLQSRSPEHDPRRIDAKAAAGHGRIVSTFEPRGKRGDYRWSKQRGCAAIIR